MGNGIPRLRVPVGLGAVFFRLEVENVLAVQTAEIAALVAFGLGLCLTAVGADHRELASAAEHRRCFCARALSMGDLMGQALQAGLLLSVTADSVIRLLPALTMTGHEADEVVALLVPLVKQFLATTAKA